MKKLFICLLALMLLAGCADQTAESKDYSTATTLADFEGARVASQSGSIHSDVVVQIKDVVVTQYPSYTENLVALKSGAVDAFVADEPQAIACALKDDTLACIRLKNNDTGFTLESYLSGVAIGVANGSPLKDEFNSILETITQEQIDELMEQMIVVNSGGTVEQYAIAAEEPSSYKGTVKVAMEACSEPFNWTDIGTPTFGAVELSGEGADGTYANGFDVQLAKYICAKLGYKLEVYAIEWDSLIPSVQSGVVDAIVSSMSPTPAREEQIDFTNIYYDINICLVVNKKQ